jgi:hypothetical protein
MSDRDYSRELQASIVLVTLRKQLGLALRATDELATALSDLSARLHRLERENAVLRAQVCIADFRLADASLPALLRPQAE